MISPWRRWACLVSWLACASCQDVTLIVGNFAAPVAGQASPPSAGESGSTSAGMAAASGAGGAAATHPSDALGVEMGARDQFCHGRGVALQSVANHVADCSPRAERELFSYALCACNELRLQGDGFSLDSFDSTQGTYLNSQSGAAVGVNASLSQLATDTQLLGSLRVAGAGSIALPGTNFLVADDFKTNAALQANGAGTKFGRDLWVASDIHAPQDAIVVGRDAYQAPGHTGIRSLSVAGTAYTSTDFSVPPPCPCDDAALLDIPALVDQARTMNDNAAAGWSADALSVGLLGLITDLPCGRLFANTISVPSGTNATLTLHGRTALFVAGDVKVEAVATLFIATPAPAGQPPNTGELDLFIRGNLMLATTSTIFLGDNARPAALRVYVGGDIVMAYPSSIPLGAQLYAPNATVDVPVPASTGIAGDAYGSIFARNIRSSGKQRMHYDRAILHAGAECSAAAPQRCDGCQQCPGDLACVAGSCSACTRDADCCAPSVCTNGKCQSLVSNFP
jgi:hypothetical protein